MKIFIIGTLWKEREKKIDFLKFPYFLFLKSSQNNFYFKKKKLLFILFYFKKLKIEKNVMNILKQYLIFLK